jgi:predicted DCC family thiol-disulfide oxidoreductase YuxK
MPADGLNRLEGSGAVMRGVVLYDDACGFCRNWLAFWKPVLARRGFDIAPLQSPLWTQRPGLSSDELLYDLRLITGSGELISGADVYLYVFKRIWWAWPLGVLFRLPGLNSVFHLAYRWFADHRYRISKTCGLSPTSAKR